MPSPQQHLESLATEEARSPFKDDDTLIFMGPEEHAEHAQVGDKHLEIYRLPDRWLWRITDQYSEIFAQGEEPSLTNAKEAASKAIGKTAPKINWKRIGP